MAVTNISLLTHLYAITMPHFPQFQLPTPKYTQPRIFGKCDAREILGGVVGRSPGDSHTAILAAKNEGCAPRKPHYPSIREGISMSILAIASHVLTDAKSAICASLHFVTIMR